MKNHTTFILTAKILKDWGACMAGLANVIGLLPATLHTDVEANLPLAIELCQLDLDWRVRWLTYNNRVPFDVWADAVELDSAARYELRDATVTAQILAMCADVWATQEGR